MISKFRFVLSPGAAILYSVTASQRDLSNFYPQWHLLRWLLACLFLSCRSTQVARSVPSGPSQGPFRFSPLSATSMPLSRCPGIYKLLPSYAGVWECGQGLFPLGIHLFLQRRREIVKPFSSASAYLDISQYFFSGTLLLLQSLSKTEAQVLLISGPQPVLGFC